MSPQSTTGFDSCRSWMYRCRSLFQVRRFLKTWDLEISLHRSLSGAPLAVECANSMRQTSTNGGKPFRMLTVHPFHEMNDTSRNAVVGGGHLFAPTRAGRFGDGISNARLPTMADQACKLRSCECDTFPPVQMDTPSAQ